MKTIAMCAALVLTALGSYGDLTPKKWNGGSGNWNDPDKWSPAGVPTADDAVTIPAGSTVTIHGSKAIAGSLALERSGRLNYACTADYVFKAVETPEDAGLELNLEVVGNFDVRGLISFGGKDHAGKSVLTVGGNFTMTTGDAQVALLAGEEGGTVTVGGNFVVTYGAALYLISHSVTGGSFRIDVGGNASVIEGSGVSAAGYGYAYPNGPGCFHPIFDTLNEAGTSGVWHEGEGGSYGGVGGTYKGDSRTYGGTYGFALAPCQAGSPGEERTTAPTGPRGGGLIRIHAQGDFTLDGKLSAKGGENGNGAGGGSGGGVWITCRDFLTGGKAAVDVSGGSGRGSWGSGGGGGRFCLITGKPSAAQIDSLVETGTCSGLLMLTEDVTDAATSPYPTLVNLSAGASSDHSNPPAERGTGVVAINLSGRAVLNVATLAYGDTLADPPSSPVPSKNSFLFEGAQEAVALTPSVLQGTDGRQRRICTQYAYSNSVGTVENASGTAKTIQSTAADVHWITWDFNRLEYLVRLVGTDGQGTVAGVDTWYEANSEITLVAQPAEGWKFFAWGGEVPSEHMFDRELTIPLDAPMDVRVQFIADMGESPDELAATQDGEWTDPATWGGLGVPGPNTAVTIAGRKVRHSYPIAVEATSLTLSGSASLGFWGVGNAATAAQSLDTVYANELALVISNDVVLADSAELFVGGRLTLYRPSVTVGGALSLSGTAKLAVYGGRVEPDGDDSTSYSGDGARVTVAGDITLADSAWILPYCHGVTGAGVRFTTAGAVSVAANAGFDATGKGFTAPNGPGYYYYPAPNGNGGNGEGGSYGGMGGTASGEGKMERTGGFPYGSAVAPFWCGSAGAAAYSKTTGGAGGGSIRIHAAGTVTLYGKLLADGVITGSDSKTFGNAGCGSGGGVWVTCGAFVCDDNARISAIGASRNNGTDSGAAAGNWGGGGGGGRVSIITGGLSEEELAALYSTGEMAELTLVTDDVNNPDAFDYPNLIDVRGGYAERRTSYGTRGTAQVWLNAGSSAQLAVTTEPGPSAFEAPILSPTPGMSLVDKPMQATVGSLFFVAGSNHRARRFFTGYVYSCGDTLIRSGTEPTCTVDPADGGELSLVWKFERLENLLTMTCDPVCGSFDGIANDGWYASDTAATVTAVPEAGWKFLCWDGEVPVAQSKDNPLVVPMDRPRQMRAFFVPEVAPDELTATQNGAWFEPATWGGSGVPGSNTVVKIPNGKIVTSVLPIDVDARKIELGVAAKLRLWGEGDNAYLMKVPNVAGWDSYSGPLRFTVRESVAVNGDLAWMSVGGLGVGINAQVSIGGDLTLTGSGAFGIYAGPVATNDLVAYARGGARVEVGGTIRLQGKSIVYPYSHPTNGASVVFKARDIEVAAGAGFNAVRAGFGYCYGPGTYRGHLGVDPSKWIDEGHGASYGGVNSRYKVDLYPEQPIYGNAFVPFWAGSSGTSTVNGGMAGGGAIILEASRSVNLAGYLNADGSVPKVGETGNGTGGSVWIRCRSFTADPSTALVTAKGGMNTWGGAGASGGGRICIMEMRHPEDEQWYAPLIELGTCAELPRTVRYDVRCADLSDADALAAAGLSSYAGVFSAAKGQANAEGYRPAIDSTDGTAVWIKAHPRGLSVLVK